MNEAIFKSVGEANQTLFFLCGLCVSVVNKVFDQHSDGKYF
jgi:hypothetical protein